MRMINRCCESLRFWHGMLFIQRRGDVQLKPMLQQVGNGAFFVGFDYEFLKGFIVHSRRFGTNMQPHIGDLVFSVFRNHGAGRRCICPDRFKAVFPEYAG